MDEENDQYLYCGSGLRRSVLFLHTNGFHPPIQEIEKGNGGTWLEIGHLEALLELTGRMEDSAEQAERDDIQPQLVRAGRAIQELDQFLVDVERVGEDSKNPIVGHIVLSPPLIF
jgi:hypothetical protein